MSGMDVLRLIVLVPVCLTFGATCAVARLYVRAWRQLPADQARATPVHVAAMAVGVLLLTCALAWALIVGFGDRPFDLLTSIRLGMYGLGVLSLLVGLWMIGASVRRRVRFERTVVVHVADGRHHGD